MRILLIILLFTTSACVALSSKKTEDRKLDNSSFHEELLFKCIINIKKLSRDEIPSDVTHAYVYSNGTRANVLLTRGKNGTFGDRDDNYYSPIYCSLRTNNDVAILDVVEKYGKSLIKNGFNGHLNSNTDMTSWVVSLFKRSGDNFEIKGVTH